ncbi:hypothetical protein CGZ88_0427 [Bifidobacterium anseris]|uniref:Uncharacterized protein n=1 Tax=Bifidobacterium anseris TaxID=2020963 RepID=A0A2N5J222_9BIFI|nr:hypothetical protein [Bifidobacterium anseris]PLS28265.1 hypothetical protein CGZ88_0427 [Bifidobacterium anseris]
MTTHEQRNCAECGEPIPSKNKQDRCDACIDQAVGRAEAGVKVGLPLLSAAVIGIVKLVLKLKRK